MTLSRDGSKAWGVSQTSPIMSMGNRGALTRAAIDLATGQDRAWAISLSGKDLAWQGDHAMEFDPSGWAVGALGPKLAVADETGLELQIGQPRDAVVVMAMPVGLGRWATMTQWQRPDGTGEVGQAVELWDVASARKAVTVITPSHVVPLAAVDAISDLDFAPDGKSLAVAGGAKYDGRVSLLATESGRVIATRNLAPDRSAVHVAHLGDRLLVTGRGLGARALASLNSKTLEPSDAARYLVKDGLNERVWHAMALPGRARVAVISHTPTQGTRVRVLDGRSGEQVCEVPGPKAFSEYGRPAFAPDGLRAATAFGMEKTISFHDLPTVTPGAIAGAAEAPDPQGGIQSIAWSPDGRHLAVASDRYPTLVGLIDTRTGRRVGLIDAGHRGHVEAIVFIPGGRRLITAGADGAVRIWDVDARRPVAALLGHRAPLSCMAVSDDGRWAATGDHGGQLLVWDLSSLKP